jgi:lipopolysaccharide export system protein LptA
MQKKILLQIFLFFLIVLITIIFFKFYYNSDFSIKETDIKSENLDINKNNKMQNIEYLASDKIGNNYNITSKFAELDPDQPDLIIMEKVKGVIKPYNSSPITIFSDKAVYNKTNHDTSFFENVLVKYDEHQILSNNLDLFFENNYASIYKNIIYKNLNTELRADKIDIDLITKNSKIFMNEKTKKVMVKNLR